MKKIYLLLVIVLFIVGQTVFTSCKSGDSKNDKDSTNNEQVNTPKPGEIPFDFPIVKTTAKTGEYVLAPSKSFVDTAWVRNTTTFIFYQAKCITPGDAESKLDEIGDEVVIPNSLIIPIPANQTAKKGDIVLTSWQSGSGMTRGIVVDDTDPASPIVKYLDLDETYEPEKCDPNTFFVIKNPLEPGTGIAYQGEYDVEYWNVIRVEGDKILAIGFAGKVSVLEKSKCTPLPITFNCKKGDKVQIPYIGSFEDGVVLKVDNNIGRVWVEIEFAGEPTEVCVPVGDITTGLVL